jgi:hypothetical protein
MAIPSIIPRQVLKDDELYAKQYYSISIYNSEINIVGYLTDKFSTNLTAEWESIINADGILSGMRDALGVAGIRLFSTGIWTRKFYKQGSYLELQPQFRIVDWNGTGVVPNVASILSQLTTIRNLGTGDAVQKQLDEKQKSLEKERTASKDKTATVGMVRGLFDATIGSMVGGVPPSVGIRIGKYFNVPPGNFANGTGMAVKSVQVTYSKELTTGGNPLYGDFNVGLSSIEVVSTGRLLSFFSAGDQGNSRVTIE